MARQYTKELLKARQAGRTIVSSGGAIYPRTGRPEWPVVYRPRSPRDPRPWLELMGDGLLPPEGKGLRLSGRMCTVEERYEVVVVDPSYAYVRDRLGEFPHEVITGVDLRTTRDKAEAYAREENRKDRCFVMGLSMESGA